MGTFQTSDGERLEKSVIDYRIKKAKDNFKREAVLDGKAYCWACGHTGVHLSASHIISVNNCQNDGMTEWAWREDNLELVCHTCHIQTETRQFNNHANANYKHKLINEYEREKRSR